MRDLTDILRRQQADGFSGFTGAHLAAFVPISAGVINEAIARSLPASAPVSELQIEPEAGNAVRVHLRIARAPLIPPLTVTLLIERQPQLPESPLLVLRLVSSGLTVLARAANRFFDALPPGVRMQDDLVLVDIAELLRQRGASQWLHYLKALEITTAPGALLLSVKASVLPSGS